MGGAGVEPRAGPAWAGRGCRAAGGAGGGGSRRPACGRLGGVEMMARAMVMWNEVSGWWPPGMPLWGARGASLERGPSPDPGVSGNWRCGPSKVSPRASGSRVPGLHLTSSCAKCPQKNQGKNGGRILKKSMFRSPCGHPQCAPGKIPRASTRQHALRARRHAPRQKTDHARC